MAGLPVTKLECLNRRGSGVRVEFEKQDDRFTHAIFSVTEDGSLPLLQSLEGSPDDYSPPSPPFAELHRQSDILFLSGATTLGHWSMSVQIAQVKESDFSSRLFDKRYGLNEQPKVPEEAYYLEFEIACRLKSLPSGLGSAYRIVEDVVGLPFRSGMELVHSQSPCLVLLGSSAIEPAQHCHVLAAPTEHNPQQFLVKPAEKFPESYPTTIQWRYGVCSAL